MRSRPAVSGHEEVDNLQQAIQRLKGRLRLAVVFGGNKMSPGSVLYRTPSSRSWKSYEAVAQDIASSLKRIGFRHVELMPDDMTLGDRLRRESIHMAWLNSGGVQGYNPVAHAAGTLEMLGVPYVGHDPLAATTLDNKHAFKREAVWAGLPTAAFSTWDIAHGPFVPELNSRFKRAFGDYLGPFIVKPASGRASLNVQFVNDRGGLSDAVAEICRVTRNTVLIERYLSGREYCIAAAGMVTSRVGRLERQSLPFTFSAVERVLADDEMIFTSMDVRPITRDRCKPLDSSQDTDVLARLHALAQRVFLEFDLSSMIRLDVRADCEGDLYILEANPKPDLKQPDEQGMSLICAGLPECGMEYDDLILSLLASRLDFLFTQRPDAVRHVLDLLADVNQSVGGLANVAYHASEAAALPLDGPKSAAGSAGPRRRDGKTLGGRFTAGLTAWDGDSASPHRGEGPLPRRYRLEPATSPLESVSRHRCRKRALRIRRFGPERN